MFQVPTDYKRMPRLSSTWVERRCKQYQPSYRNYSDSIIIIPLSIEMGVLAGRDGYRARFAVSWTYCDGYYWQESIEDGLLQRV